MNLEAMLRAFIAEYGERAVALLKAILEESREGGNFKLGDFSVKGVRVRLKVMGVEYNPVPLLSKLEKEIGAIETTYRSTTQRWWKIIDKELVQEILREYEGGEEGEDPRVKLLRIQYLTLNPHEILETLNKLAAKNSLTQVEKRKLREIAFKELPLLLEILEKIRENSLEEDLAEEAKTIEAIIAKAEEAVKKHSKTITSSNQKYNIQLTSKTPHIEM